MHSLAEIKVNVETSVLRLRTITLKNHSEQFSKLSLLDVVVHMILCLGVSLDLHKSST
jgi:hypothetical protein